MSNKNKPRLSLKGDPSVQITAPTAPVQAVPNSPIQEKIMEANQAKSPEEAPEQIDQTAKQMAAAEEINQLRARRLIEQQNAAAEAPEEQVSIIGLAAQGREVLLDQLRQHADRTKPKEYVPPPRTERQMSVLEEELNAGRRSVARAEAQQAARVPAPPDPNEGFTTPVYRPNNLVPDPTIPATVGAGGLSAAGTREFGTDAP